MWHSVQSLDSPHPTAGCLLGRSLLAPEPGFGGWRLLWPQALVQNRSWGFPQEAMTGGNGASLGPQQQMRFKATSLQLGRPQHSTLVRAHLGLLRAPVAALGGARMLPLLLLLLSGLCEWTAASSVSGGVECISFNEDYMTCDWGSKRKPAANYSLYYWYSGESSPPVAECKRYLQAKDGINTGCWFNVSEIRSCCDFCVYLNASHAKDIHVNFGHVQHLVKPGQPFNLTVRNVSSNELLLTWDTPFSDPICLEHAVKYKTNKDSEWMEQRLQQMMFNIPSVDPDKRYTFYVRSKIRQVCGNTDLWSEMTGPISWGRDPDDGGNSWFWIQNVLLPVGSFLLLLAFLVLLVRMERVWLVLMPRIPNPSKKFEDLFTAYRGNFSEWAGVSKDAVESFKPNYRESICRVSELLPGGGYLPVCSDAVSKAGRVPGGSADHHPQGQP